MRESASPGEIYPDAAWLWEARGTTEAWEGTRHPARAEVILGDCFQRKGVTAWCLRFYKENLMGIISFNTSL